MSGTAGRWARVAAAALGLAAASWVAGCTGDGESDRDYAPSVNVNGPWNVLADGEQYGRMALEVGATGTVGGTLAREDGAVATIEGAMDDRAAEFTVEFPEEEYLAVVTFGADAASGRGTLANSKGIKQILRLARP